MEHESGDYTNCNWCSWCSHQKIGKRTRGLRYKGASGDHPNYSIVKIDQNTEESPGDSNRLVITQTPGKDHQLTLIEKFSKNKIIIIIKTNFARKVKKLWNIKVMAIPKIETIQTIVKIGQNTQKSPGDLRRPEENLQSSRLDWKFISWCEIIVMR